ncbi:MAG TPA: nitrate- and nitrite sensing domain-containing protein [Pseudonocardia sp.]|nr:nitrate- and nitrite sensing domain-containing protein [Pseudonocardia sp.]
MTSTAKGSSRFERLQPRNWSLPVKLAAVLMVPTLLGVALGVARIVEHTNEAASLASADRFVDLEGKTAALIGQLQRERDQSSVFVQNNRTGDKSALQTEFGNTDGDVTFLATTVGQPASMGGAAQTAYQQAKDNLDRLSQLRDQVLGSGVEAPAVIAQYTGLIQPLLVLEAALDRQLNTPVMAGPAAALTALTSVQEQVALQHAVIAVAIIRGQLLPPDADTVHTTDAQMGAAVDQFRAALDADQQSRYAGFTGDQATAQRQQLKQAALSRVGARGQLGISPADWDSAYNAVVAEMRTSADGLRGDIQKASDAQQESFRNAAGIDSVILLLALLAAATVVYLIGRSMLKPLKTLRTTALDIAERRLPAAVQKMRAGEAVNPAVEPVPVHSIEEIGQVARAFDEVHGQAIRLAAEQSALQTSVSSMFVNLSRRSQGLVERQLQLIEQLERNEQDSEQLANLFQLDHLATRMRRNSENLLVLAGSDLAKRGSAPVPVVDVLRAAVSEIEQYQRVVVQQPPAASIVGRAASDMVHLVAELLDNATSFSAPDTQVVVSSSLTPDGNVQVEIADQGVGMPGADLLAANNRLSGPNEVDVSASRRMGLFVVGRLAARHGVGVRLASTEQVRGGAGVTASVTVPAALVATASPVADRIGTTNALPTGATEAVTRAGVAPSGLANGVAVNGTGGYGSVGSGSAGNGTGAGGKVNGTGAVPGVNGTGRVNGTGTGFGGVAAGAAPRDGGSDGDPNGLPRRVPASESGGLPRRAAGAALGGGAPRADLPRESVAGRSDAAASAEPAVNEFPETRQFSGSGQFTAAPQGDFAEPEEPAVREPAVREPVVREPAAWSDRGENGRPRQDGVEGSRGLPARQDIRPDTRQDGVEGSRPLAARRDGVDGSRSMPARPDTRQDGVEGSRPMAARQDARPDIRPDGRQDGVEGSRPMPANGRPPLGGRRTPQQPYLRGAQGQGPPPPMRFGQPAGPPGQPGPQQPGPQQPGQNQPGQNQPAQPVGSPSGQFASSPAGQQPPPAAPPAPPQATPPAAPPRSRHRPAAPEQPPAAPSDSLLAPASPLPSPSSVGEPSESRGYPGQAESPSESRGYPALSDAPGGRALTRAERRANAAAARSGRSSAAASRDTEGESPIFAEMASAWFRENWEVGGQSGGGPGGSPGRDSGESDDTWAAGDALLQPMPDAVESELTTAGLPKRRPRSNLIPGGPSEEGGGAPPGIPARSAEQVRGRLASYQQGVRQGRESRHRRSTETASTGGRQMQENFGEENP